MAVCLEIDPGWVHIPNQAGAIPCYRNHLRLHSAIKTFYGKKRSLFIFKARFCKPKLARTGCHVASIFPRKIEVEN